jgi:c-di-GMP-binding flagellar brake protein YcgR
MTDVSTVQDELKIQDRVLVEADILGRPVSFRAVIVKICADELWLGMSSPDRRLESMHESQTVHLTIARNGAALLGQSGFLRPLGGSKSRVFAVVRPGNLERVQRRAHVRYQIDLPIHFRHLDPVSREPRGKAADGMTINVGPGGLLFETELPVGQGEELDLTLPLSGGDRISMVGLVTRVRGAEDAAGTGAGQTEAAVRFTRVTAVDQDRIVRFILMTEHRRREAALREAAAAPPAPAAPVAVPGYAPAPAPVFVAPPAVAAVPVPAPRPVAPAAVAPASVAPAAVLEIDPNKPLIAVGLHLCEGAQRQDVRRWFDGLVPGARIELLSQLQANMTGGSVPGAEEPGAVRPLAVALGLLAA